MPLGDGDDAAAVFLVAGGNVGDELVHVEVDLGQVDKVAAGLFFVWEGDGGSQPAGVTTHALMTVI